MGSLLGLSIVVTTMATLGDEIAKTTPKPPELNVLERLIGKWDVECTEKVAGKQTRMTGTMTTEWILDGHMVQVKGMRNPDKIENLQLIGFDPRKSEYILWYFDAAGTMIGPARGQWDEKSRTLTWRDSSQEDVLLINKQYFIDKNTVEFNVVGSKAGNVILEQKGKSTRQK
jgi:hypothetical protein